MLPGRTTLLRALRRFDGLALPQISPDAPANQKEKASREEGRDHLENLPSLHGRPERQDGEPEEQGESRHDEKRGHQRYADPEHQAQAPRAHRAPSLATASSTS